MNLSIPPLGTADHSASQEDCVKVKWVEWFQLNSEWFHIPMVHEMVECVYSIGIALWLAKVTYSRTQDIIKESDAIQLGCGTHPGLISC